LFDWTLCCWKYKSLSKQGCGQLGPVAATATIPEVRLAVAQQQLKLATPEVRLAVAQQQLQLATTEVRLAVTQQQLQLATTEVRLAVAQQQLQLATTAEWRQDEAFPRRTHQHCPHVAPGAGFCNILHHNKDDIEIARYFLWWLLLKHSNECSMQKRKGNRDNSISKTFRLLGNIYRCCNIATSNMGFAIFYYLSLAGVGMAPFIPQSRYYLPPSLPV
jgi:hypothetical protein